MLQTVFTVGWLMVWIFVGAPTKKDKFPYGKKKWLGGLFACLLIDMLNWGVR